MANENIFELPSADQFDELNANLVGLYEAKAGKSIKASSWAQVQQYVRRGVASKIFAIGDQLSCQKGNETLVWDVIGIDHDIPSDPQFTHSLTLQLHDCFPTTMQFDAPEAFYYAENGLEAGTYHFTANGTNYQFTLESAIAADSQLILNFTGDTPTSIFVSAEVGGDFVKDTNGENNLTIAVTAGSGGDELNADYLNDINRVIYGSNNYKESTIRQWLNSDAAAGSVWSPQNNFDRPPFWISTADGFMYGMDEDFLAVLGNVTKVTARNTTTDGGGSDTTTDTFFLLSRSEVYGGVEVSGVNEGEPYPYYADYSDLSAAGIGADSNRIKYFPDGTVVNNWWTRTPYCESSKYVRYSGFYNGSSGKIHHNNARSYFGIAPACNII